MDQQRIQNYDQTNKQSIHNHARILIGQTLQDLYPEACSEERRRGKGSVGNLVEKLHFGIEVNNLSRPDFPLANLELKTTALVPRKSSQLVAKERLSLSMIDYDSIVDETFYTSAFQRKNAYLLIMVYLYLKHQTACQSKFLYSFIYTIPEEDKSQIERDWHKIQEKVKRGDAHLLSEGDTLYLAAATKGADSSDLADQPFSDTKAKRRAFCFKRSYIEQVIKTHIAVETVKAVSIVGAKGTVGCDLSLEDAVIERCTRFVGMDEKSLFQTFGLPISKAKHRASVLIKRMLGVGSEDEIAEFLKSGINVKSVRTIDGQKIKESMSFAQIDYHNVVSEEWESSYWNNVITNRFLIMVFDENSETLVRYFRGAFFWSLPSDAEEDANDYWCNMKRLIERDEFAALYKLKSRKYFHVRPKARNAADMVFVNGKPVKKMAYWINRDVISDALRANDMIAARKS